MRRLLLACFFILVPTLCLAQNSARMDEVLQSYVSSSGFAGTVLVARGDSVVFSKAYGVSADAASPVASITKQFTAAAILLLEERGRLRIDDLVSTHLPEAPPSWKTMTLFHLLTHTAGFQGLFTPPAARRGLKSTDGTLAGFVQAAMQSTLDTEPGASFNYNNSGYFVLGHLIQTITGQPYERFIQDNFLT
ncbi:MAG TPA: serine hydrolase domain-containing protein, partial [Vicinamibacterales bacterium]|nr:serine hydrolase domain-containing protein [Vicinamibacterales bacterium]